MIELEVIGNRESIVAVKSALELLAAKNVREYHHKGVFGEAEVFGLITGVPAAM